MKITQILALAALLGSIPVGHAAVYVKTRTSPPQALLTFGYLKRKLGWSGTAVVAVLILAKGFIPVHFARNSSDSQWIAAAAGLVVVLSDCFPYWLMFKRSGTGLAAALGTLAGISLPAAAGAVAVWGTALALSRRVSVASMAAAVSAPVWLRLFKAPDELLWYALAGCAYVIVVHSASISRLLEGTEPPAWGAMSRKGRSGDEV